MKIARDDIALAAALKVKIYLDGIQRTRVVSADEEGRCIEVLKHDGTRYVLNADRTEVETEILRGEVAIVFPADANPKVLRLLQQSGQPRQAA